MRGLRPLSLISLDARVLRHAAMAWGRVAALSPSFTAVLALWRLPKQCWLKGGGRSAANVSDAL